MESKIALRIDKFIFFSLKKITWNRKSDKNKITALAVSQKV